LFAGKSHQARGINGTVVDGYGPLDPVSQQQLKTVAGVRAGFYPAYSLSGSEGEGSPVHQNSRSLRRGHQQQQQQQQQQHYHTPSYAAPHVSGAGLSDTPTSENASDATLTDSELALARDSTLLVQNGEYTKTQLVGGLSKKSIFSAGNDG